MERVVGYRTISRNRGIQYAIALHEELAPGNSPKPPTLSVSFSVNHTFSHFFLCTL